MRLNLTRPLACIDIEATGPRPETDRIIELAVVTLHPDGSRDTKRWVVDPGRPIPSDSTAVHGFTDADVHGAPLFEEVAGEVAEALTGADLCGFNLRAFDIPILRAELSRAGAAWPCDGARVVDAFVIFRDREPRSLAGAVRFYLGRSHDGAHQAESDAEATLDVLLAQLDHYPDLPRDLRELDVASGGRRPDWATELGHIRWGADGDAIVAFGRHNGLRLIDMDEGFLQWVLRSDFPGDVQAIVRRVCIGERPRAPGAPPIPPPPPESDDPDDHFDDCDDIPF